MPRDTVTESGRMYPLMNTFLPSSAAISGGTMTPPRSSSASGRIAPNEIRV